VHDVDQRDLQGNVLCGYGNDFARGVFLFVNLDRERPVEGRRWLRELAEQVTDAEPWAEGHKPSWTLNVALSHAGLRALGVPKFVVDSFPEDFREGMGARAERIGDTGTEAPESWEHELRREAHVLLTVTARTRAELRRREAELTKRVEDSDGALVCVYRQSVGLPDHSADDIVYAREHFGFADGFSQPAIRGNAGPTQRDGMGTPWKRGRWKNVAPGEFVLGYEGEDGVLPAAPVEPLERSGSFMVVRKLEQRVRDFRGFLADQAKATEMDTQALAARIVGRWQDGRSLVMSQTPPPAEDHRREAGWYDRINRFRYAVDPDGYRCPLGAHVRRANPRDGIGRGFQWHGKLTRRHRIIRRGMPYPDPSKEVERARVSDNDERGLMFVCYQASIERQFELIQGKWLNDGNAFWLGDEKDFLTIPRPTDPAFSEGNGPFGYDRMTIQHPHRPRFLAPHPSFVKLRGGGYYFTPGISALRALGSAYWL